MGPAKTWGSAVAVSILLAACSGGGDSDGEEGVGQISEAVSVCNEAVPADRFIDGFPAYAQCPGFENAAIYSNNGIDTATSAQSTDWVRTQYSGGYQCTELAKRYWVFKWNVTWQPRGNAGFWCDETPPANSGVVQTQTPVHGDMMVLPPGSCGAGADTGHVAVVDTFDAASGRVTVVQQNRASRGQYNLSCGKCFLHVVKNGGASGSGGVSGSGGASGSGGVPNGSGGVPNGSGGSLASGGASSASGGVPAAGGGPAATGGISASGGFPAAGAPAATGGVPPAATGGLPASGGMPSTGGVYGQPAESADEESGCSVSPGAPGPRRGPLGLLLGGIAVGLAMARRRARRSPD